MCEGNEHHTWVDELYHSCDMQTLLNHYCEHYTSRLWTGSNWVRLCQHERGWQLARSRGKHNNCKVCVCEVSSTYIFLHYSFSWCSLSESVVAIVVGRIGLCSDTTVRKSGLRGTLSQGWWWGFILGHVISREGCMQSLLNSTQAHLTGFSISPYRVHGKHILMYDRSAHKIIV